MQCMFCDTDFFATCTSLALGRHNVRLGSGAAVLTLSADRPVYPPLPISCCAAANRRWGPGDVAPNESAWCDVMSPWGSEADLQPVRNLLRPFAFPRELVVLD